MPAGFRADAPRSLTSLSNDELDEAASLKTIADAGGSIRACSEGTGLGASFILTVPHGSQS